MTTSHKERAAGALLDEALQLGGRRKRLIGSRRRLRTATIEHHHLHEQQLTAPEPSPTRRRTTPQL